MLDLAGVELVGGPRAGAHPGLGDVPAAGRREPGTLFSGDLLFAGSIGRTDLPGGDYATILDSLARVCLPLPDETEVLSGHGPATTIGAERQSNPFLAGLVAPGRRGRRPAPTVPGARRRDGAVADDPHP